MTILDYLSYFSTKKKKKKKKKKICFAYSLEASWLQWVGLKFHISTIQTKWQYAKECRLDPTALRLTEKY